MTSSDRLSLMHLVSEMYYLEDKTQNEIAEELNISRPKVSRLLSQARADGIVQITVINPLANMDMLAEKLKQKLGLSSVVIAPGMGGSQIQVRKRLGATAARYFERSLQRRDMLGIGWGRSLYEVATSLEMQTDLELTLVPLMGGLGQIVPSFQVHSLARIICEKLGGTWLPLYVPAIIEDSNTQDALLATRDVNRIVDAWNELDVAVVGIGISDLGPDFQILFADYMTDEVMTNLSNAEAVGDICMRFFDIQGDHIPEGLQHMISIRLEDLKKIPRRIGVAGGVEKAEAIIGAARGGYINILITDETATRKILEIINKET